MSADDLVLALTDVNEGRVPKDLVALDELLDRLKNWPFLEDDEYIAKEKEEKTTSSYAEVTDTGLPAKERKRPPIGRQGEEVILK